jgi:putative transposase
VSELRARFGLKVLLEVSGIRKSTYFYASKHAGLKGRKDRPLADEIERIFRANLRKYGVPRVAQELRNEGWAVNRKRVERIMRERGLSAEPRKRAYHSYKGDVGKVAPDLLKRDFSTTGPYQKLGTDVTQFITEFGKLYLSPVIDFHTREVLAYDISTSPDYAQVRRMLESLVASHGGRLKGAILTSDQGYQYQLMAYRRFLKEHGMSQSMSRKGNCLDNSPTENFFGRLKVEMYYDREYSFKSLADLERQIRRYIAYWNSSRIVGRLGASPISVRNAELGIHSS